MSKSISIQCPQCRQTLNIRPEYAGKRAACKHCEAVFTIVLPSVPLEESKVGVESVEPNRAEIKALRDELAAQRESMKSHTVELETARQANKALQAKLDAQESRTADLQSRGRTALEESQRIRSELESKLSHLESESAQRAADWLRFENGHESLKVQLRSAEERFASLQTEIERGRSEHAEKEANWVHFAETHDELKSRLESSDEVVKGLQAALEQSQSDRRTLEADREDLMARIDEAERGRVQEAERAMSLRAALEELQPRLDDQQRTHDESSQHWQLEKAALQKERDELLANIADPSSPSSLMEEEIQRLREELAAFPPLVEDLKQNLESARSSEHLAKSHLYQLGIRLPN